MDAPADGDELARVVPLRRRDRELTATPGARGMDRTLPRERAPFDPEIEPSEVLSAPRLPGRVSVRAACSALGARKPPRPQSDRAAARSWRYPSAVLLTGAAGAALAAVVALAVLASSLNQSPLTSAATVGVPVSAAALEPTKPGVLSARADPFGRIDEAAAPKARPTPAVHAHHLSPKPTARRTLARSPTTTTNRSAVVGAHAHKSPTTSSPGGLPDNQAPATTHSTAQPIAASTPHQSTSPTRPRSSAASVGKRPAFGNQGLLGPGSSPDS
jgi:hypothetical protein